MMLLDLYILEKSVLIYYNYYNAKAVLAVAASLVKTEEERLGFIFWK